MLTHNQLVLNNNEDAETPFYNRVYISILPTSNLT